MTAWIFVPLGKGSHVSHETWGIRAPKAERNDGPWPISKKQAFRADEFGKPTRQLIFKPRKGIRMYRFASLLFASSCSLALAVPALAGVVVNSPSSGSSVSST